MEEPVKKKLLLEHIVTEEEEMSWELDPQLSEFFQRYCKTHIPESDIKEKMKDYPLPTNVDFVPKLDQYMIDTLKDEKHGLAVDQDADLKTIQQFIQGVMGPFGVAWYTVEMARIGTMELDLETLGDQMQKAAILLGHAMQKVSWFRRVNVLSRLSKNSDATRLLKQDEVKKIFMSNDTNDLFGKEFDKHLEVENTSRKNILAALKPKQQAKKKPAAASAGKPSFQPGKPFSGFPSSQGGGYPSGYNRQPQRKDRNYNPFSKKRDLFKR